MKSIIQKILLMCLILLSCVIVFTACGSQEEQGKQEEQEEQEEQNQPEERFYCNNSADDWNYYNTLVQKTAKANAIYRAVKINENNGDSIQYEIRYKETNALKMIIEYDKNGKILSHSENYSQTSVALRTFIHEYNNAGLLEKIFYQDNSNENYLYQSFEYGLDKQCVKTLSYNTWNGTIYSETVYEWSDNKKTVDAFVRYYDTDDQSEITSQDHYRYEYDDSGRVIKKSSLTDNGESILRAYHYNGSILQKETHYNTFGSSTDISLVDPNTKWYSFISPECEYDSNERLSKLSMHDSASCEPMFLFHITFEYDDKDNKIRESIVHNGKTILYVTFEYGEDDACTKSLVYDDTGKLIKENQGYTFVYGIEGRYSNRDEITSEYRFALRLYDESGDWLVTYGMKDDSLIVLE